MDKELRRAPRVNAAQAVNILLRDGEGNREIAEPVMGTLYDVSTHGARITVSRINSGACHLFYSFNDTVSRVLVLEILENETSTLQIPMRPVWFDHDFSDPSRPFQLGLEFLLPPDSEAIRRLCQLLEIEQPFLGQSLGGWLRKFFSGG